MSKNKGYYLQSDNEIMDLYYLEYNGEKAPENIQFTYNPSNIHDLEKLIHLLNKKDSECNVLDHYIDFLHQKNIILDRRITKLYKHLERIYESIEYEDWDRLKILQLHTHDYEEIK